MFILQHKFTMDKSKLNLGANVGDIPRGVTRPEVQPGRTWRLTNDPDGGSIRERTRPKAQKAGSCYGGPVYEESTRNILLQRKQD